MNQEIAKKLAHRIKELRMLAGMSQQRLAEKLRLSRPAISQIENCERKISAAELIRIAEVFNISVEDLLDTASEPEIILSKEKSKKKGKAEIRINVPQKNIAKFREVLLYILNKIGSKPNIGETIIYKLLYFIDFNYYEKYEEQLIGATYKKNRYGPTPLEFKKIVDSMIRNAELMKIDNTYFQYPQTKYLPLRAPDLSVLKANELEIIDDVLFRFSDMNAAAISQYSHNDVPWLTAAEGENIEYESVFYRIPPYSVREYNEDV